MKIYQQLLAASSHEPCASINKGAQDMIAALVSQIKAGRSTRKQGDLVFETVETAYPLPLAVNKEKTKTRWELFAETKGLKLRKKSKLVYCEELKKWIPRWGSQSLANMKLRGGVVEVEQSISKLKKEKQQRISQNTKNRDANKKRISKL
ncbi:regulator of ribosome biosynthesis [Pancytospora philotis]|nr:regulator of ribosome biosynthesis [Pancytospora philotis]